MKVKHVQIKINSGFIRFIGAFVVYVMTSIKLASREKNFFLSLCLRKGISAIKKTRGCEMPKQIVINHINTGYNE